MELTLNYPIISTVRFSQALFLRVTVSADSRPLFGVRAGYSESVLIMANANIAFFYWCPVSGLLMVVTVWALHGRRLETTGVVNG